MDFPPLGLLVGWEASQYAMQNTRKGGLSAWLSGRFTPLQLINNLSRTFILAGLSTSDIRMHVIECWEVMAYFILLDGRFRDKATRGG